MSISMDDNMRQLIDERLKSGRYASAEDVLFAGLAALEQHESYGEFEAGELDALLAEGERGIESAGAVDAAQVFEGIRRHRPRHGDESACEHRGVKRKVGGGLRENPQ